MTEENKTDVQLLTERMHSTREALGVLQGNFTALETLRKRIKMKGEQYSFVLSNMPLLLKASLEHAEHFAKYMEDLKTFPDLYKKAQKDMDKFLKDLPVEGQKDYQAWLQKEIDNANKGIVTDATT